MLFKKQPKPHESAPAAQAMESPAPTDKAVNGAEIGLRERRQFPRPMPVPEVVEQDWSTWEDVTNEKTSDKQD